MVSLLVMKTLLPLRFVFAALLGLCFAASSPAQGGSHLPIITAQPTSQSVHEGAPASFTVIATASGELNYRWYRDMQQLDNANASTLLIHAAKIADAGSYRVEVSNSSGTVTSSAVTLTVNASPPAIASAPTITMHPTSLVVNNGSSAVFSVTASGAPVLEYQWMKNEVPIGGATSPTLALTGIKLADAGAYSVRVSNSYGSLTSNSAMLTVNVTVSLVLNEQ